MPDKYRLAYRSKKGEISIILESYVSLDMLLEYVDATSLDKWQINCVGFSRKQQNSLDSDRLSYIPSYIPFHFLASRSINRLIIKLRKSLSQKIVKLMIIRASDTAVYVERN